MSHDDRSARAIAFESVASDIVRGARLGTANVYVVLRRAPWYSDGSPWTPGPMLLVSRGLGGRTANGASYAPVLSGWDDVAPRCLAFLSRATNLVAGAPSHVAQAYVAELPSLRLTRVSVNSEGQPADRAVTEVSVSGNCRRVAFVSTATNLAQTRTTSAWRGVRTERPRDGRREVYVRFLGGSGPLTGLTMLASAGGVQAADADADQVSLSRNGDALAFATAARDLGTPANGQPQIIEQHLDVRRLSARATQLRLRATLVSATSSGSPGDGPSARPAGDDDGRVVVFQTLAGNLLVGATGVSQVVRASLTARGPGLQWLSADPETGQVGNAPSEDASVSDGGEWAFFDSDAGNYGAPFHTGPPGQRQVYRWSLPALVPHGNPMAATSDGGPFNLLSRTPAWNGQTSARGNYLAFESEDPGLDPGLPVTHEPPWYPGPLTLAFPSWFPTFPHLPGLFPTLPAAPQGPLAAQLPGLDGTLDASPGSPNADARLHQVYVRFLGSDD